VKAHEGAPPAVAYPVLVSQRNCLAVLGLTPRQWLGFVRVSGLPVVKIGALRLVETAVVLAYLRCAVPESEGSRDGVDAVLCSVGRRVA
jgi:hypothetical protein